MGELHYFRFLGLLAGQMLNKTQTTAASLLEESAAAFTPGLLALCSYTCHLDFQTELLRRQTLKLELRSWLGRVYFASSFSVVGGGGTAINRMQNVLCTGLFPRIVYNDSFLNFLFFFFFKKRFHFIFAMLMCVCDCVWVCPQECRCLKRPEALDLLRGVGVTGSPKLQDVGAGNWAWVPLKEQWFS